MLSGQYDWYIVSQVSAIKSGKRSNKNTKKMYPFVKNLSKTDIADLGAYISTLPVKKNQSLFWKRFTRQAKESKHHFKIKYTFLKEYFLN